MTIRSMLETDAATLAELSTQLGYPAVEAQLTARIKAMNSGPDMVLVAASEDGKAIGWIHLRRFTSLHSDPVAEICALVVDSEHRSRGVGTQLVAAAVDWARAGGFDSIRVRSNAIRKDAHRFYQRLGFQIKKTSLTFDMKL
jgi:GNAT superfamily N-acetyltransferase